ncbi:hypothetical protein BDR05DRAFT_968348 [Suillus weaverae]|nr:hypothetical protein BDR05DRAFT_968348 [Suillus weaverae]
MVLTVGWFANSDQNYAQCLGLCASLFLFTFHSWLELPPSPLVRMPSSLPVARAAGVDRVLNEEVDIIIDYADIHSTTAGLVSGVPGSTRSKTSRPVIINVCGLGGSTYPAGVQSSRTLADITGNLTCVVEHVGSSLLFGSGAFCRGSGPTHLLVSSYP